MIIKPRRHVDRLSDLTDAESVALGPMVRMASAALERALAPERVYLCSFGELVRHVHWYVISRYAGMPDDGLAVLAEMFSDARPWACSDDDAAEAAAEVRAALVIAP